MRRIILIAILLSLSLPAFAGKDKDKEFKTGKIVDLQTQDQQASNYNDPRFNTTTSTNPGMSNSGMSASGGSFSSAPAHFVNINVLLETPDEMIWLKGSWEASYAQPELKNLSDVQYRLQGPKFVELIDVRKHKYEFQVVKRLAKPKTPAPATQPAPPAKPAPAAQSPAPTPAPQK
jgi:hypothetical protein